MAFQTPIYHRRRLSPDCAGRGGEIGYSGDCRRRYKPFSGWRGLRIPGNDDSSKAAALYIRGMADAILAGRADATQQVVESARDAADGADIADEEFVEIQEEI